MKKVIYILNLLFLTLSVFGGSVFAAAPTEYVMANGSTQPIPGTPPVNLNTVQENTTTHNYPLTDDSWYYIDGTVPINNHFLYVESGNNVNIVVADGNQTLNLGNFAIFVPDNGSISFWAASNADGNDNGVSLKINQTGTPFGNVGFVIGNDANGRNWFSYSSENFGKITFNSGSYTITNDRTNLVIGSSTTSGGTIAVNPAAEVTAYNSWNNGSPGVAVGVGNSSKNCTIQVNGGLLQATNTNGTSTGSRVVSAGDNGTVTISGQGKILSAVNPNDSEGYGTWNINSGIAGYTLISLGSSRWAAVIGGTVNLPVAEGVLQQDLTPPVNANYTTGQNYPACWNLLTVNPGAVLNLGTTNPGGTTNETTLLVGYTYGTPSTPSSIENYGTVNVIDLNQRSTGGQATYPSQWNNYADSVLTIAKEATLGIWGDFDNSASDSNQSSAGEVTIEGTLYVSNSGVVQNSGNLNITQSGLITGLDNNATQVTGIAGVVNSPEGTVTLGGTVDLLTRSNSSFQNYGTLDNGPIGTVDGGTQSNLINEAGGTVTS